jgi:hypothetical protein
MVAERVPLYMENGNLVVGKRVAKTFTAPELRDIGSSFGVAGLQKLSKDQVVTELTRELKARRAANSKAKVSALTTRVAARKAAGKRNVERRLVEGVRRTIKARKNALGEMMDYLKQMDLVAPSGKPKFAEIYYPHTQEARDIYTPEELLKKLEATLKREIKAENISAKKMERASTVERVKKMIVQELQEKLVVVWVRTQPNAVKNYAKTKVGKRQQRPSMKKVMNFANKLNKKSKK